tara:strand:- start:60374 stop:60865 length:492 start_codon:yes stop_codon:yes gene_type:complete
MKEQDIGLTRAMKLTSTAFEDGGNLPVKYSCDHDNISPALAWSHVPEGVKSFAIIADDPDAPAHIFVHWIMYNIPADLRNLPEHIPDKEKLKNGALQGRNDFRKIGYGGPCPPEGHGPHHYHFKLYALDIMLDLEAGVSKEKLEIAIKGHVLDWTQLIGIYER